MVKVRWKRCLNNASILLPFLSWRLFCLLRSQVLVRFRRAPSNKIGEHKFTTNKTEPSPAELHPRQGEDASDALAHPGLRAMPPSPGSLVLKLLYCHNELLRDPASLNLLSDGLIILTTPHQDVELGWKGVLWPVSELWIGLLALTAVSLDLPVRLGKVFRWVLCVLVQGVWT